MSITLTKPEFLCRIDDYLMEEHPLFDKILEIGIRHIFVIMMFSMFVIIPEFINTWIFWVFLTVTIVSTFYFYNIEYGFISWRCKR